MGMNISPDSAAAYIAAEYNRITGYFVRNTGMNLEDYRFSVEKHGLSGHYPSGTWRQSTKEGM
jgi:hypothetical protein